MVNNNKVTAFVESVKNLIDEKQDLLESGTNIKTVNSQSLLGSGDIIIQSGSGVDDYYFDSTNKDIVLEYTNGGGGGGSSADIVTEWEQVLSDEKIPSEKLVKNTIDTKANSTHTHIKTEITDFPTIPTKTSDLTNDSGFLTQHQSLSNYVQKSSTNGLLKNDGSVDSNTYSLSTHNHSGIYSEVNHTHSNYVNPTIADNLTTNDSSQVLSAKQGKVLNDLIGDAISYINQ